MKKSTVAKSLAVVALVIGAFFFGAFGTAPRVYKAGYKDGYVQSLRDIKGFLNGKGISFSWKDYPNGTYQLSVWINGSLYARSNIVAHLWIEHRRNGELLSQEYGAGVLTNTGKDWIEQQLSGTINSSQHALYLSDSNNSTDPPLASWNVLPNEITTNGLDRQTGTYTSTGTGTWNVTVTKTATGTQSTQLWGINADSTDGSQYLVAADSGPAQKNLVVNDTLKETWQISVS